MNASVQRKPDSELEDGADRDLARLSLDRNVVVEAGAGTGKTTLLTDRALFLLLGAGVPVAEIVALTFTEKAAGEIRVRLSDLLVELLAFWQQGSAPGAAVRGRCADLAGELRTRFKVGPDVAARRARAALEDMDKAVIGTLHSFAARLLRAYPLQAGVDPEFQVDEGGLFEELFASEWAAWLDAELSELAPRGREWLPVLRLVALEELDALAAALCGARVDLERVLETPTGMSEWLKETAAVVEAEPGRQPAARGKMPERLREVARRLRGLLQAGPSRGAPASLPAADLPPSDWPKGWSAANEERCEQARRIAAKASPEGEALIRAAAELVIPFCREFRRTFNRRGRISFDGLLVAARGLARDHPEVREELKSRYRAFLVDEFQDTDPLQGELLFYLAEKKGRSAKDWRDAELEPGKLFVVGDPKQSIYRFRGADLAAYEGFLRGMRDQSPPALACALTCNFRSYAGILAPVNAVFDDLMVRREGSQPAYRAIAPAAGAARGEVFSPCVPAADHAAGTAAVENLPAAGVEFVVFSDAEDEALPVEALRRAEADWIADWIVEHQGRPYALKSIALLLRTTAPLEAYLAALKERGVPYVVEAEKYFYATQEVLDFLNLLRALDDPLDRVALAGLLRSPLVAVTDAELARLAAAGGLDYAGPSAEEALLEARAREGVPRFYAALRELRGAVGRAPLGELMRRIEDRTQVLELLFAAYHGEQTLSNLFKFMRMAAEAADARGLTLKGFIEEVSRSVAESREEGESPLADEHLDAVRVLTIHKAKGLEFPAVIVPNLGGAPKGGGETPVLRLDWSGGWAGLSLPGTAVSAAAAYLEQRERGREDDEAVRLLYVAMTRAKERLILVGAAKGASGSFARRLSDIGAWPGLAGVRVRTIAVEGRARGRPSLRAGRGAEGAAGLGDLRRLARRWKERLARRDAVSALRRHVSPTEMGAEAAKERDLEEAGPRRRRAQDAGSREGSRLLGRVCHAALERRDWRREADPAPEIGEACRALRLQSPGADWEKIREEAHEVLERFLESPAARILREADILGREIPFVYGENGAVVRGTIDVLYRLKGGLWVADYKTGRVTAGDLAAAARRYRRQGAVYLEAARRALAVEDVGFTVMFLRAGKAVEVGPIP